jgi:hypothetical protein
LLRLGILRGARHRLSGIRDGCLLLQTYDLGLSRIARLAGGVQLGTGGSRLRTRLHEFLEQVAAHAVEPGDFVFGRPNSAGDWDDAKANGCHNGIAGRAQDLFGL